MRVEEWYNNGLGVLLKIVGIGVLVVVKIIIYKVGYFELIIMLRIYSVM